MTVLPTVRHQIQQAAERQAGERRRRPFAPPGSTASGAVSPGEARRRGRLSGGGIVAALGMAVAICTAIAAVTLLGHGRGAAGSPPMELVRQYPLNGDGIGKIRFGGAPDRVVAGLERLLGLPEGAGTGQRPHGLVHSICGFDHEVDWEGLPVRASASRYTHSAGLTVYFRHSRFAGYSYGPAGGDRNTLARRRVMLLTSNGLGIDAPVARARRLYGATFVTFMQPQGTPPDPKLERLPAWHVRTPAGLLYGSIDSPRRPRSPYTSTIGSISAGSTPNTPCRG